jgi:hypothetical protein
MTVSFQKMVAGIDLARSLCGPCHVSITPAFRLKPRRRRAQSDRSGPFGLRADAVLDIACERDGAADLLRGRTFARVLH